jgi:serine/threonine-protein kinase
VLNSKPRNDDDGVPMVTRTPQPTRSPVRTPDTRPTRSEIPTTNPGTPTTSSSGGSTPRDTPTDSDGNPVTPRSTNVPDIRRVPEIKRVQESAVAAPAALLALGLMTSGAVPVTLAVKRRMAGRHRTKR